MEKKLLNILNKLQKKCGFPYWNGILKGTKEDKKNLARVNKILYIRLDFCRYFPYKLYILLY